MKIKYQPLCQGATTIPADAVLRDYGDVKEVCSECGVPVGVGKGGVKTAGQIIDDALSWFTAGTKECTARNIIRYSDAVHVIEAAKLEAKAQLETLIQSHVTVTEKAYGGCHNCYGKGYATYRSAYTGIDTDQDIGSPGGRIYKSFEKPIFCECSRGRQLESIMQDYAIEARIAAHAEYKKTLVSAIETYPTHNDWGKGRKQGIQDCINDQDEYLLELQQLRTTNQTSEGEDR